MLVLVPANKSSVAKGRWCLQQRFNQFGDPLVQMGKILHDIPNIFDESVRLRTHNQNRTVAARAIADMKTFGHLS